MDRISASSAAILLCLNTAIATASAVGDSGDPPGATYGKTGALSVSAGTGGRLRAEPGTDIAAALQTAIDSGVTHFRFGAGTWTLSGQVEQTTGDLVIEGVAPEATILRWQNAPTEGISVTADSSDDVLVVRNVTLHSDKTSPTGTAISYIGSSQDPDAVARSGFEPRVTVQNVHISGASEFSEEKGQADGWKVGVRLVDAMHAAVEDSVFSGAHLRPGASRNIASRYAVHAIGRRNPSILSVEGNEVYFFEVGLKSEGIEGVFVAQNNFVAVSNAVVLRNDVPEPGANIMFNHFNCYERCMEVRLHPDAKIIGNHMYARPDTPANIDFEFISMESGSAMISTNTFMNHGRPRSSVSIAVRKGSGNYIGFNEHRNVDTGIRIMEAAEETILEFQRFEGVADHIDDAGSGTIFLGETSR